MKKAEFDRVLKKLSAELVQKQAAPAILAGITDDGKCVAASSLGSEQTTIDFLEEFLGNLRKDMAERN